MNDRLVTILHIKETDDFHAFGSIAACVDYLNHWFPHLNITAQEVWNAHLTENPKQRYEKCGVVIFKCKIIRKSQK